MLAVHARYRGRETRRADLVRRSGEALSTMEGVAGFESLGAEDIRSDLASPEALCNVEMALLSDGAWAIGVGVAAEGYAGAAATAALGTGGRAGTVKISSRLLREEIAAVFLLIAHVLSKRSLAGREATSLMRAGFNQNEAAAELGISKQAMSQRLHAAGGHAELAGWRLAVNLISMADR